MVLDKSHTKSFSSTEDSVEDIFFVDVERKELLSKNGETLLLDIVADNLQNCESMNLQDFEISLCTFARVPFKRDPAEGLVGACPHSANSFSPLDLQKSRTNVFQE